VIVVDASALADALVDDGPGGETARAALGEDVHWAAPAHLLVEVVSVVRDRLLGGKVSLDRGTEVIGALTDLAIEWVDPATLVRRMWELRANISAYDAAYVAAAEVLGCPLVTGDARLARATGPRCEIRPLGGHC
jgi:predicted nucleic acid-binding protein